MKKSPINHGVQFRDDDLGVIVNWFQKKGTVFVQKNLADLEFPKQTFNEADITSVFNQSNDRLPDIPTEGICSDAGTHGNPGPAEYNVADLDGNILDHKELGIKTNNYAELYGIYAGLNYCTAHNIDLLWTDSQTAMQWIESGQPSKSVHNRDELISIINDIHLLLADKKIELKKWHTELWGEIPADFGRK